MSGLSERIVNFWNNLKQGEAKKRAYFKINPNHIKNGDQLGQPFSQKEQYFQVIINEMWLANSRFWFAQYDPMSFTATSYIYGKSLESSPYVVGPATLAQFKQDLPQGFIFKNTPVSGLHPYGGGKFTITVILNRVQHSNNAEKILNVLEKFSSSIDLSTSFSAYLKIAGSVMDGVEALLDLKEVVPVMGFQETFNPDIGLAFEPAYFALIDDQSGIDPDQFWVKHHSLHFGTTLENSQEYRDRDFVLFSIKQATKRTDDNILPFYALKETAIDLAARVDPGDHYWSEAKAQFNTLKRELLKSPDLTKEDYKRLRGEYLEEMKARRTEAVMESELGPAEALPAEEAEMAKIADELQALDKDKF